MLFKLKKKSRKEVLMKRTRCIYYPEGSNNSKDKGKISLEAIEEQLNTLSQPMGRESLDLTKKLYVISAKISATTKMSVPNSTKKNLRRNS